ncbi:hypothetical protein CN080_08970 [Sinorhizobium meliloti]|nr:hypothetical protein CN080_08970 [Sinorhizobium meliloti]
MTMMAVETTVLFPCSRYRNRPEICQSQKRALFRNIPANRVFNMRSYFRRLFSPLNFDWRTIACVGQLQRSIPSSGALIFFQQNYRKKIARPHANRAAVEEVGDRCSSDRDAFLPIGLSPCSIQGNRFERRLPIFYSQRKRNQRHSGSVIGL